MSTQYGTSWIPPAVAKIMGAEPRWYKHEVVYADGVNTHYLDGVKIITIPSVSNQMMSSDSEFRATAL